MNYILANIKSTNHKVLSLYYLAFAIVSLVAGVIFSLIIKIELYESGISSDNLNFYNLDITLHGFFVLMPGLFGGLSLFSKIHRFNNNYLYNIMAHFNKKSSKVPIVVPNRVDVSNWTDQEFNEYLIDGDGHFAIKGKSITLEMTLHL